MVAVTASDQDISTKNDVRVSKKEKKRALIMVTGISRNRDLEAKNAADLSAVLTHRYDTPVIKLPPMRLYSNRTHRTPILEARLKDVTMLLKDVRAEAPDFRIWLVGLGIGGAVTARLLGDTRKHDHLEGVILCDPQACHPDAWRATTLAKFQKIDAKSRSWNNSREFAAFGSFQGRKVLITSPTRNMDKREIFSRYGAKLGIMDQYRELSPTSRGVGSLTDLQTTHELAQLMGECITTPPNEIDVASERHSPKLSFAW